MSSQSENARQSGKSAAGMSFAAWIKEKYKSLPLTAQIGAVISCLAVIALCILFRHQLLEAYERILEWVVSGVVASLIASWIVAKFMDAKWETDAKDLRERLDEVNTHLKQLQDSLAMSDQNYHRHLDSLPKALGGDFTESLLCFYPYTSEKIAGILSRHTCESYQRHCKRVLVTDAADTYRLAPPVELEIETEKCTVWPLVFHCTWTWENDSQVTLFPLQDFVLTLCAPAEAWQAFQPGIGRTHKAEEKLEKFWKRTNNFVKTIVPHPGDPKKRLEARSLDLLWKLSGVKLTFAGAPDSIQLTTLEELPQEELPPSIYRAYRMPSKYNEIPIRDRSLERGERLVVEYYGELALPVLTGKSGVMHFPPSDVIAESYVMSMLYPAASIDIDQQSGCILIDRTLAHFVSQRPPMAALPSGFPLSSADGIAQLMVKEKSGLTDLHRIHLGWHSR